MRKHSTLLLLSAAALLLTATPTFAQSTSPWPNACDPMAQDCNFPVFPDNTLPNLFRQWRFARQNYLAMMDTEKRLCQLPDSDLVAGMSAELTDVAGSANGLIYESPNAYWRQRSAQLLVYNIQPAQTDFNNAATQLPASCSG